MSDDRRQQDEVREAMDRLEREFHARPRPPQDDAPQPQRAAIQSPPQRVARTRTRPRATAVLVLLLINLVMFVVAQVLATSYGSYQDAMYALGALWRPAIDAGQWWRLITPVVLHWDIPHLLFNSLALYWLGSDAEAIYGTRRFLAVYWLAGLGGSVATYIFSPGALSAGASGAIFGLFGALGVWALTSRSIIGREATRTQLIQIGTMLAFNLFYGFAVPNIGNAAHIGGLITGAVASFALAPRYEIVTQGGMRGVGRRDTTAISWIGAVVVLVVIVGLFLLARFGMLGSAGSATSSVA